MINCPRDIRSSFDRRIYLNLIILNNSSGMTITIMGDVEITINNGHPLNGSHIRSACNTDDCFRSNIESMKLPRIAVVTFRHPEIVTVSVVVKLIPKTDAEIMGVIDRAVLLPTRQDVADKNPQSIARAVVGQAIHGGER